MTLEIVTSDLLAAHRHGFFTRRGGASSGVFSGLNCGIGSSDQAEMVEINRARVAEAMEVQPAGLKGMNQTHSTRIVHVESTETPRSDADGMVTATPGIALSVLTADCQPVLFADPQVGIVGAAHGGWRGTLDGVLEATVDAMEQLGARRDGIVAAIGPTISQAAYEVGPEFFETFMAEDPESARYFVNGDGDRMLFDLPGYGLHRLRRAGLAEAEWTRHCTYRDPERFFSYRRSTHAREADYGRLISVIRC